MNSTKYKTNESSSKDGDLGVLQDGEGELVEVESGENESHVVDDVSGESEEGPLV